MGGFNAAIITQGQNKVPTFDELRAQFEQAKIQKQQMALQQQAIAEGQQGMQIKAMQLEQAKKADAQQSEALGYLQKNAGDVDKTIADLVKSGNPQAFVFQKNKEAIAEQAAKTQEIQQKIADSKQKQDAENASHVASLTQGITDLPPELQGLQYKTNRAIAIQHGYAKPEDLPEEWSPQTAQIVQGLGQNAVSVKDQIEAKQKAAQQKEVQRHNVTGESLTAARDLNTAQHEAATLAETQQYHGVEAKQRQQQIGIEGMNAQTSRGQLAVAQGNLSLRGKEFGQQYGDPLQSLSGAQLEMAKKYASGDFKLPPAGSRAKGAQAIREAALAINPNLTDETYNTRHSFKSGKDAEQIGSITRIMGHLDNYAENSGKLGFAPLLATGVQTPGNAPLHKDVQAIGDEFGKLVAGKALTQEEAKQMQSGLLSMNPATRQAAIGEVKRLMGSQFEAKFQKYKTGTGMELNPDEFFDKSTQQRLAKQGLAPVSAAPQASAVPASAQSAIQAAIPKGAKIKSVKRID